MRFLECAFSFLSEWMRKRKCFREINRNRRQSPEKGVSQSAQSHGRGRAFVESLQKQRGIT